MTLETWAHIWRLFSEWYEDEIEDRIKALCEIEPSWEEQQIKIEEFVEKYSYET